MGSTALTYDTRNDNSNTQKTTEDVDIISNLPENIISHILSFLLTKDAVRTSVLSTRWIYLWTSITNLRFYDSLRYQANKESFMNFVDRVLVHVNAQTICSFTLVCHTTCDPYRVNSWISSILRRNVQKLHVVYPGEVSISSRSLFNCNSLEEFQLCMFWKFVVPTSATLSNLRILKLQRTTLVGDSTSHLKELTVNLPVLKVFEVKSCKWIDVQSFSIKAPLLESFYASNLEIEFKHDQPCNFSIKIFAWHLKKFSFYGKLLLDIVLLDSISSPLDVIISLTRGVTHHIYASRACMLLKQFPKVEYLKLAQTNFQFITNEFAANLPTFESLLSLEVKGPFISGEILSSLVDKAPNLMTLHFKNVRLPELDDDYVRVRRVPRGFARGHFKPR